MPEFELGLIAIIGLLVVTFMADKLWYAIFLKTENKY